MEQFYSKKNNTSSNPDGPSELTIKRILAFSKAMNTHGKKSIEEDTKDALKD